jgi:hypothetical protein
MTAAQQTAAPGAATPKPQKMIGEWFWRFLAVVMLATVGWVLWIMYQINPQSLITKAGFEAAAKARASQDAKGVITPAAPATAAPATAAPATAAAATAAAADGAMQGAASASAEAPKSPVQAVRAEPKEPPVNPERLKFADTIETPISERGKKK